MWEACSLFQKIQCWQKIGIGIKKEGSAKALMLVLTLNYASGISTSGPSNKEKKMDDIYKWFTTSLWIICHLITVSSLYSERDVVLSK